MMETSGDGSQTSQPSNWEMPKSTKRPRQSADSPEVSPPEVGNQFNIQTSNRYDVLNNDAEADQPTPPIYVQGVALDNYKTLITQLSVIAKDGFECQSTQRNGVTIYPRNSDNYRAIVRYLKASGTSYHSFQLSQDKAYRVVLRHLNPCTEPVEIQGALEQLSFKVRSVTNVLQSGTRIPLPLFFVDLEPQADNTKIFELNSLLHTRVKVEEPRKKRDIVQCKRCLQFGHTRTYCNHAVKCARCGEQHLTPECKLPSSEPRKCSLCQGNHSATYKGCNVYKELRSKRYNHSVLVKANRRIDDPQPPVLLKPSATTQAPLSSQTQFPNLPQTHLHKRHGQSAPQLLRPRISERDPRVNSASYSDVLSGHATRTERPDRQAVPPNLPNTHAQPSQAYARTDSHDDSIAATLGSFLSRFHDLITPLISTLTLLINKLLATHV